MRKAHVLAVVGTLAVLAIPMAPATPGAVSAGGSAHWTIELPNPFGVEVLEPHALVQRPQDRRRERVTVASSTTRSRSPQAQRSSSTST